MGTLTGVVRLAGNHCSTLSHLSSPRRSSHLTLSYSLLCFPLSRWSTFSSYPGHPSNHFPKTSHQDLLRSPSPVHCTHDCSSFVPDACRTHMSHELLSLLVLSYSCKPCLLQNGSLETTAPEDLKAQGFPGTPSTSLSSEARVFHPQSQESGTG